MIPTNALAHVFADIVFIPSGPKGENERARLNGAGYGYLCVHDSGLPHIPGRTAYVKPTDEYAHLVEYYRSFRGCYFQIYRPTAETMLVVCKAEQIISSRTMTEIPAVADYGVPLPEPSPAVTRPQPAPHQAGAAPKRGIARPTAGGAVKNLDDFTRGILARCTAEGHLLKLPGKMIQEDYRRVDAVLRKIGGRWKRAKGGHEFPFPVADMLDEAVKTATFVDRKQDLQLFETPEAKATDMVSRLEVRPGDEALEPSAGLGRLVRPLKTAGARVTAVELDEANADMLAPQVDQLHRGDFLAYAAACTNRFDVVAMNPPFTRGQDMAHIQAAFGLLKPGGRLAAIASDAAFTKDSADAKAFRAWLEAVGAEVVELPAGTFSSSGPSVRTRMIVARSRADLCAKTFLPAGADRSDCRSAAQLDLFATAA